MNLLKKSWKGEASLAQAFWLVYVLFGLILLIIIHLIVSLIYPIFDPILKFNVVTGIFFPYKIFSVICVWRCSKNSIFLWKFLARLVVLLDVIFSLVQFYHALTWKNVAVPPGTTTTTTTVTTKV